MLYKTTTILLFLTAVVTAESPYQPILTQYVKNAKVDYPGLKKDLKKLNSTITSYKSIDTTKMNQQQKMAMWINAYNLCTLKLIVDYFPLKTINEIPKAKRWKHARWEIAGKTISLDDIEHKILRPMGDPRIHFAINCASFSCPDLSSFEYKAETLDKQLEEAKDQFLDNS
jgi:hypothetical protein